MRRSAYCGNSKALRDEEVRFLREQLARRENGAGNDGNGNDG